MSTNIVLESFMGRNSCSGHWINIATSEAGTINPSTRVLVGFVLLWSLVLCVCFVDRCLSFCTFFFGHCAVCPSIYGFWLPLWYLQTLLLSQFLFYFYSIFQLLRQYGIYFFILFSIAVYVFIIIKLITKYSIF